jgi:hypothetical protein
MKKIKGGKREKNFPDAQEGEDLGFGDVSKRIAVKAL